MECPNCGKTDSKVIDSRLSKDRIAIRRRRQCLICASRYTTYEATAEQSRYAVKLRKRSSWIFIQIHHKINVAVEEAL